VCDVLFYGGQNVKNNARLMMSDLSKP